MSKMTKPTVDVVRFTESDVIVASGGMMTITGLGNGSTKDARFVFGPTDYANYTSSDIITEPGVTNPYFFTQFNSYFETNFNDLDKITVGGETLLNLVSSDLGEQTEGHYSDRNGTYRWNGTYFDRMSQ